MLVRGRRFSRRMLLIFSLVCGVYFVLPPLATLVHPKFRGEIYPMSMWSMFYRVHNRVEDYGLKVLSMKGEKLPDAPYFEDAGLRRSRNISAYHAIQKLGRGLAAGDRKGAKKARKTVEKAYLPRGTTYEIVERSWDPYERFQEGTFLAERVLWSSPKSQPKEAR